MPYAYMSPACVPPACVSPACAPLTCGLIKRGSPRSQHPETHSQAFTQSWKNFCFVLVGLGKETGKKLGKEILIVHLLDSRINPKDQLPGSSIREPLGWVN